MWMVDSEGRVANTTWTQRAIRVRLVSKGSDYIINILKMALPTNT